VATFKNSGKHQSCKKVFHMWGDFHDHTVSVYAKYWWPEQLWCAWPIQETHQSRIIHVCTLLVCKGLLRQVYIPTFSALIWGTQDKTRVTRGNQPNLSGDEWWLRGEACVVWNLSRSRFRDHHLLKLWSSKRCNRSYVRRLTV